MEQQDYLAAEARARLNIDAQLRGAGWIVQDADRADVTAGRGVAIREFVLQKPHGRVDYLLFVDGQPAGVIEAKPEGTTLTEVEHRSGKYVEGVLAWMTPPVYPLPYIYESTGTETHSTNGYNSQAHHERTETERFRPFTYDELIARDKASLDTTWLRDESLEDTDNLPAPHIIAAEIVEDLEEALAQFTAIADSLSAAGTST